MKKTLLEMEKRFFQYAYISNEAWLSETIHDQYTECGKSGCLFHKADTIRSLLACETDRSIIIYNFDCEQLSEKTWIVHYYTVSENVIYYRTSIWLKENGLRLRFHQATEYHDPIDLLAF